MAKSHPVLDRKDAPVSGDPIAEEQAASDQQAAQRANEAPTGFDSLVVDQGAVEAPSEKPEPEVADVKDTTVQQPPAKEQLPVARVEPRRQDPRVVSRPVGARTRESSPQGAVQDVEQTSNSFAALIAKEKISGTAQGIWLISFLEDYVRDMAPGRITSSATVLKYQESLYDNIVHLLERVPANEFKRCWNLLIAFVREYGSTCFSPTYYSRGAKEWRRSPAQFHNLTLMMNLLQASGADLATVNQQVNVNSVVEEGYTESARGRLISFYMN